MSNLPTNPQADKADEFIKSVIFKAIIPYVTAAIIADMPILGAPIIKQILNLILSYIGGKFEAELSQYVNFGIIDRMTDTEKEQYNQAVEETKAAYAGGDPDAISKAKENFKDKLGKLIHFDGA